MNKLLEDPIVLREVIMDHYEYPRNHSLVDDPKYKRIHMASESCIDDIHVQADIEDGIVKAMKGLTTIEEVVRVARLEDD